ncbi:MAG TPA: HAMP domain-containing sensor histidine kinase [Isosphaeraceae bacterium]
MNSFVEEDGLSSVNSGSIATEADRRRGLFSCLSRELCSPLISIRAGFDLLLAGCEGDISAAQREQMLGLKGHCDSLIGLTRSFLDYAGADRAARPPDLATFRLAALIEEADRQFSRQARARGVEWSCGVVGPDARVTTDLACLQHVIGRLVENALAYTRCGGKIGVTAMVEDAGWVVEVLDDGPGIPHDALDRVFEPLTRLGSIGTTSPSAGTGHGMGLAVCRELVGRLGGTIEIRSMPGRGTSVSVCFPTRSTQSGNPG